MDGPPCPRAPGAGGGPIPRDSALPSILPAPLQPRTAAPGESCGAPQTLGAAAGLSEAAAVRAGRHRAARRLAAATSRLAFSQLPRTLLPAGDSPAGRPRFLPTDGCGGYPSLNVTGGPEAATSQCQNALV